MIKATGGWYSCPRRFVLLTDRIYLYMELHQIRYFIATAETGSVSRAAERCRVAQPSLSQQIRRLEDDLGVRLFDRQGRGMALTEAGRALLPRARRILAEVRDVHDHLRRDVAEGHGELTVGAIPTMAPFLLPRAVQRVRKKLPECRVSIREGMTETMVAALVANEIDVALVSTPLEHELIEVVVLGAEELILAMPRDLMPAGTKEVRAANLQGLPTVALEDAHCLGRQIEGFCASRHLSPRVVCRTTQITTVLELVALGMGVAIVPEMAAAAWGGGGCGFARIRPNRPQRQIAAAWRRDRTRGAAAGVFVESVRGDLKGGRYRVEKAEAR